MADNNVLHAKLPEHIGRYLSGIGAARFVMAVFRSDGHPGVLKKPKRGGNVHIGYAENDGAPFSTGKNRLQLLGKGTGFGEGFVHLPVSGDNCLAVSAVH
ncbi:hypothetical protein SDC9_141468 [bioreactor metagenome]|uniref:Uncharacterized protein n=1 Tax=bioreactor metagenome TaxID=1076179 RepID=A0A645E157_9ZZZZ